MKEGRGQDHLIEEIGESITTTLHETTIDVNTIEMIIATEAIDKKGTEVETETTTTMIGGGSQAGQMKGGPHEIDTTIVTLEGDIEDIINY